MKCLYALLKTAQNAKIDSNSQFPKNYISEKVNMKKEEKAQIDDPDDMDKITNLNKFRNKKEIEAKEKIRKEILQAYINHAEKLDW